MSKRTRRSDVQLDETTPDPASIVELLDSIPGAYERAQQGLREAEAGEGTPLDEVRREIEEGLEQARRGELVDGQEVFKRIQEKSRERRK